MNGTGARSPDRSMVAVVPPGSRLGYGKLVGLAAALGLCVNVAMRLVLVAHFVPTPLEIYMYLLVVLVLVIIPVPRLYRGLRPRTVASFAIMYTIAILLWNGICELAVDVTAAADGSYVPVLWRSGTRPLFIVEWNLILLGVLGTLGAWIVCRWKYGRIIEQDGTLCPNCAYSLLGSTRQVCSECGREFTFQELGTTQEWFESVKSVQGRVARPVRQ